MLEQDVPYGKLARQRLDIYRPAQPASNPSVIVYFYGGGWSSGKRSRHEFVARTLASKGHYVVIPDYRIFPEVVFPEFVNDSAHALSYVIDNMTNITDSSLPVFLLGHSAGAHIAMLLGLDQQYLVARGHDTFQLSGVIGLAGPYAFQSPVSRYINRIFPGEDNQFNAQPVHFVDPSDPPIFLGHGDNDRRVNFKNSVKLAVLLEKHNVPHQLSIYENCSHSDMLQTFMGFLDSEDSILDDILVFISAQSSKE